MSDRAGILLMTLCLLSPVLQAEDSEPAEAPPLELLEFLGQWETRAGDWIDPAELDGEAYEALEEQAGESRDEE